MPESSFIGRSAPKVTRGPGTSTRAAALFDNAVMADVGSRDFPLSHWR
jgi:hypothetical protein